MIKKTWCHGQLVAPLYSILILWWYAAHGWELSVSLIFPICYFPYWCYLSYRNVFVDFSYKTVLVGGILAEVGHLIVILQSVKDLSNTMNLLLFIASGLFLIETAAFLCVVTALKPTDSSFPDPGYDSGMYQESAENITTRLRPLV